MILLKYLFKDDRNARIPCFNMLECIGLVDHDVEASKAAASTVLSSPSDSKVGSGAEFLAAALTLAISLDTDPSEPPLGP